MFTFLRRTRQSLINSGKLRKYLLYGIGEIALVVIGILIALQINNWNENEKTSRTEEKLLIQLANDLEKSIGDIKGNIKLHEAVFSSSNIIIQHFDQRLPYHDSLSSHFSSAFLWSRLVINEGAYETIKSHGVEIISNIELREKMIDIFGGRLFFLRELERISQEYVEKMRSTNFVQYFEASFVEFGPGENGFDYGKCVPHDFEKLSRDTSFRYHLTTYQQLSQTVQNIGNKSYKESLEELLELVQMELKT